MLDYGGLSSFGETTIIATFMSMFLIPSIVYGVINIVANWMVFTKAGEAGWKILIPIYNTYILFKIVTGNGWKMFFLLIPIFGAIYAIIFPFKMARAFGRSAGFGCGLLFLNPIFILILAFSSNIKYVGPDV